MDDTSFVPKYVYQFQHVDLLSFVASPEYVQSNVFGAEGIVDLIPYVESRFRGQGWEGDGDVGLIWIPPFVMEERGTQGVFVWFVKQGNNGTAFIASPFILPFDPIQSQN